MKSLISSSLQIASLAAVLALSSTITSARHAPTTDAAAAQLAAHGHLAVNAAGPYVEIGTPRIQVLTKLGSPRVKLADGRWIYQNHELTDSEASGPLVVRFTNGHVSSLTIISPATEAALIASSQAAAKSRVARQ